MRNPYRRKTEEEVAKEARSKEEIGQRLKFLSELGKKCLSHPDFIKYKDELDRQKDQIIRAMIETVNPDPIQDAYFLRACLNKLSAYYELLDLPNDDAARRPLNEGTSKAA